MAYIDSLVNYETNTRPTRTAQELNLVRMTKLMAALGNPHKNLRCAHIAGTKGKGSTAAMLSHMLSANGLHVGLYTSPHLMDIRERIEVAGRQISEAEFARLISLVADAARVLPNSSPTFFEALTACAFLHFAAKKVDVAVLETGLGGRLDCTNVVPRPEVCGLTTISYDHMQILGHTLAAIAEEKAGIMKPGVTTISAPQAPEVKRALRKAAEKHKSPLMFVGDDLEFSSRFESSRATGPHIRVSVLTPTSRFEHVAVPMLGDHQALNCAVALGMLDVMKGQGFKIADDRAIAGLSNVKLQGRMELVHDVPRVIVDGAHNPASIEALMRAIGQNVPYDSMVVVFGCNSDKDVAGMLRLVQLGADKVIFTASSSPRAVPPAELAAQFTEVSGRMAQTAPNLDEAIRIAGKAVTRDDLLCVTGSFYLVADAKRLFQNREYVRQLLH